MVIGLDDWSSFDVWVVHVLVGSSRSYLPIRISSLENDTRVIGDLYYPLYRYLKEEIKCSRRSIAFVPFMVMLLELM